MLNGWNVKMANTVFSIKWHFSSYISSIIVFFCTACNYFLIQAESGKNMRHTVCKVYCPLYCRFFIYIIWRGCIFLQLSIRLWHRRSLFLSECFMCLNALPHNAMRHIDPNMTLQVRSSGIIKLKKCKLKQHTSTTAKIRPFHSSVCFLICNIKNVCMWFAVTHSFEPPEYSNLL